MTEKQRKKHFENVCDECEECNYFIDNDETEYYECIGSEQPCNEWLPKR